MTSATGGFGDYEHLLGVLILSNLQYLAGRNVVFHSLMGRHTCLDSTIYHLSSGLVLLCMQPASDSQIMHLDPEAKP